MGRIALHPALADLAAAAPDPVVRPVASPSAADLERHGPSCHGVVYGSGGRAPGVVTTLAPPPGNGAYNIPSSSSFPHMAVEVGDGERSSIIGSFPPHNWALPKLDFPSFDGDNPQFWQSRCEKYFDVYGVQPELWVRVATLHFTGNAARWLQLQESHRVSFTWEALCAALRGNFGREQYQVQLRQFRTLRQTGTVHAYMTQFEEIMHQLLAHNSSFDSVFFTTQFLEGLKHEIRMGVLLHQPKDLDSAFSLAALQEELVEALPHREFRRQDVSVVRQQARLLLALGSPPALPLQHGLPAVADDKRGLDAANAPERQARGDDRVAALRNYRRAHGLCFKCIERWGQGQQCVATVQLHVVEELLDLLQANDPLPLPEEDLEDDVLMSIFKVATIGQTIPHTVRLVGRIAGKEVLVLVDSGSSHSFISEAVASRMSDQVRPTQGMSVKIADGGVL